jgi:signal peptidase I
MWSLNGVMCALCVAGCGTSSIDAAGRGDAHVGRSTARGFRVPSESMEPTLTIGTRVVVGNDQPVVGAIAVFYQPEDADVEECGPKPHVLRPGGAACDAPVPKESKVELVKRVVAGPGDEIYVRDGHVFRRAKATHGFVRERDSYIRACGSSQECNFPEPIRIPAGHWFMMGDNRGASLDSRFWGPVPTAWIVGMAAELECPRFLGGHLTWMRRSWQEGCQDQSREGR